MGDRKRTALVVLEVIVGLNAIGGGIALLAGAMEKSLPVSWLHGSPFSSYQLPGLALVLLVGGSSLLAASLMLVRRDLGIIASAAAGLCLVVFELAEAAMLGVRLWLQPVMLVLGLVMILLALAEWRQDATRPHLSPFMGKVGDGTPT